MPGRIARDGPTRTVVSADSGALFSRHKRERIPWRAADSLRSSHFRLRPLTKLVQTPEAEQMLSLLETNRTELLRRVSAAGIAVDFPNLEVFINETTGDFVGRTGMPPWAAAATKNNRIELQPLKLLKQRRILETTLRHELVHVLIDAIGGGQTPRWLTEGMAIYVAGEGRLIERHGSRIHVCRKCRTGARRLPNQPAKCKSPTQPLTTS